MTISILVSSENYQTIIDSKNNGDKNLVVPVVDTSVDKKTVTVNVADRISDLGIHSMVQTMDDNFVSQLNIVFATT